MLATCTGRTFGDTRDEAVLRMFMSSGARLSEVSQLTVAGLDLDHNTAVVVGKASKPRVIVFDEPAAKALRRYIRQRKRHHLADSPELWLGQHGTMTSSASRRSSSSAGARRGSQFTRTSSATRSPIPGWPAEARARI